MDFEDKKSIRNPHESANPVSRLFYLWLLPILVKGTKKTLDVDDLYDAPNGQKSSLLADRLLRNWKAELEKGKGRPKLARALIRTVGKEYLLAWIPLVLVECIFRVAQSLFLRLLVGSFSKEDATKGDQYLYAAGVTLSTFLATLSFHLSFYEICKVGAMCRVACSAAVYRKALNLSTTSLGKTTIGQVTNILSNDLSRFDFNPVYLPYLFLVPIQLVIYLYFIWQDFGVSTFVGVGIIVLIFVAQYWNGTLSTKYRSQIASRTDERGRLMNEVIVGMRVIKMYAWEKPFTGIIDKLRRLEMGVIKKRSYFRGIYLSVNSSAAKVVPFLTFLAYVLSGNDITAEKVFFFVSCYNVIIQSTAWFLPSAVSGLAEINVALQRVQDFLMLEEKGSLREVGLSESSFTLRDFDASWIGETLALQKVNLTCKGNQVVCVVGPVGSGKTTLLHALIEELRVMSGSCEVRGRVSYAAQEPWIFAGNVRQNILFGRPFDESRYEKVTRAAALLDDFKQLAYGDLTIVGDRGVSLSGGQKARLNLARSLYQEAEIYLLDDPLSAVDTKVSRHLFEECVKRHLDGHLRILVTHQLQYLPQADHIVVLNEGRIVSQGKYEDLVKRGVDFVSLLSTEKEDASGRKASIISYHKQEEPVEKNVGVVVVGGTEEKTSDGPSKRVESMAEGSISPAVYWKYIKAAKSDVALFFLSTAFLMTQVAISFAEYWLSLWTNAERKRVEGDSEAEYLGESTYLWVYGASALTVVVGNILRSFGFFSYATRISVNMHNQMFTSVVRSPTKFFDHNPSGRVMNRFTKDLGSMDELLPPTFFDMIMIFLQLFGVVGIVIASNYFMAIPAIIVLGVLYVMRKYYIITARAIKRVEGVAKSPMFTHTAASLQGLATIRAARAQDILVQQFDGLQDIHSSAYFIFFSCTRGFQVWIEIVSIIFQSVVTFGLLLLPGSTMGGNVGLVVSSAILLTFWFQFGMRQSAEVENHMTSVERNLEYADLPPEASLESSIDKKPPSGWPSSGAISFRSVSLAYEDKDVLTHLTFDIKPQEKIGIVGRTGAGKSSIIQALFRMTEPRGDILIDGVRVNDIGLHDLRQAISIIPQDPVLFSGTMRYNLDPFGEHADEELWKALEDVDLNNVVSNLDFAVSDGGSNFSVGQRQLVCLARAIVRNNRILVMDEATANVDPGTDQFIQEAIRRKFKNCTIITIAHRLLTVMDSHRILVLDNGRIKEYDSPYLLLKNPEGVLRSMVNETGSTNAGVLYQRAKEAYVLKCEE